MSLRSKRPARVNGAEQVSEKAAAGFFDGFEPSASPVIDQRKWRAAEIITGEPAPAAPEPPASRGKIEGGKRLNLEVLSGDDLRDLFSTHRAERAPYPEAVTKREAVRAKKAKEQDERAWRGWAWLATLGLGRG